VIFEEPHRFPQHRAAHPVALQQRRFGSEDRTDPQAAVGDVVADGGRQHLGEFAAGSIAVESSHPARLAPPTPAAGMVFLQPGGHPLDVSFAERLRPRRIPRGDGGDELRVVVVHLVDRLDGLGCRIGPRLQGVSRGEPHQDVDEQLQDGAFRLLRQRDVKLVARRR
jgi:hypothetical protein